MVLVTITLLGVAIALGYLFLTWNYDHWRKRKVPGPTPKLLIGNYPNMYTMKRHPSHDLFKIYREYKQDYDAVGIYLARSPQLLITSPELAYRVFVSDFKCFHDNQLSYMLDENSDFIVANNMFALTGAKWKQRRGEITPGITMSRVKSFYPITNQACKKLNQFISEKIRLGSSNNVNAKNISLCFTTEKVTDCALGLSAKSFTDNPTPIMQHIKDLFNQSWAFVINNAQVALFPMSLRFKKLRMVPQHVEKFFVNLMQNAIDSRKSQIKDGKQFERNDFLDYIVEMGEKQNISTRQLTANTMIVLADGFETTASVLAHTMLCLGRDDKSQERLRQEIRANLNDKGFIDYDKIHELPFMDACIQETIRLFPAQAVSKKLCTKSIEVPNRKGSSFTIEKGTTIIVANACFMKDEDFFPNPEVFQPDRFMDPDTAKAYRDRGIFMPFGAGPRICIGMRFALTQIKAALVEVLTNFDIKVNPKTRKDNLLEPFGLITKLDGGVWLNFTALE